MNELVFKSNKVRRIRTYTHVNVYICHFWNMFVQYQSQTSLKMYFIQFKCSSVPSFFYRLRFSIFKLGDSVYSLCTQTIEIVVVVVVAVAAVVVSVIITIIYYSEFLVRLLLLSCICCAMLCCPLCSFLLITRCHNSFLSSNSNSVLVFYVSLSNTIRLHTILYF